MVLAIGILGLVPPAPQRIQKPTTYGRAEMFVILRFGGFGFFGGAGVRGFFFLQKLLHSMEAKLRESGSGTPRHKLVELWRRKAKSWKLEENGSGAVWCWKHFLEIARVWRCRFYFHEKRVFPHFFSKLPRGAAPRPASEGNSRAPNLKLAYLKVLQTRGVWRTCVLKGARLPPSDANPHAPRFFMIPLVVFLIFFFSLFFDDFCAKNRPGRGQKMPENAHNSREIPGTTNYFFMFFPKNLRKKTKMYQVPTRKKHDHVPKM